MAEWRFVLTDDNYTPLGEILNASDRQVVLPLSKTPTAQFAVMLDNPMVPYLQDSHGYLKGYRDGVLKFYGPIVSVEERSDAQNHSMAVNAAGPTWYWSRAVVSKDPGGTKVVGTFNLAQAFFMLLGLTGGLTSEQEERYGVISETFSNLGAGASITDYNPGPYRYAMDVLDELAQGLDGFEWKLNPIENYTPGTGVADVWIAEFLADPVFGIVQQDAVFEYNVARNNVQDYQRVVTRDSQANKAYHLPAAGLTATGTSVATAEDTVSQGTWGILETIVDAQLDDPALRTSLVEEHVRVRAQPKQTFDFTPHIDPQETGRLPDYDTDFTLGDTVRVRISYQGDLRYDIGLRVWGVTFDIDSNNLERMKLTVADQ